MKLAERLNVVPGIDSIQLLTMPNEIDGITGMPKPISRFFPVTGVFDTGLYEYDNQYVIISLAAAQEFAQLGKSITGIEVKTKSRWMRPNSRRVCRTRSACRFARWTGTNRTIHCSVR